MNRITTIGLFLSMVAASWPAAAQVELQPVVADAERCSTSVMGATIEPGRIGEPVSGVSFERIEWFVASERAPAMCLVEGQILPVDTSGTARPIKFAVALPGSWNRRSIHQGGSGMNGVTPRYTPGSRPAFPGAGTEDLARGFVVYGSDSGHGVQETQWTLNDEVVRNMGYAQLKKTNDVAQILIHRLYGQAPRYRYFVGASQGGREGVTVAQRYPVDYDGVAANVPILALNSLMQAPAAIRRQEIPLANWVTLAKAKAIAAEFMRQCDGLDGLDDALINNYVACREIFNVNDGKGPKAPWAARRCPGGRDPDPAEDSEGACLTDGQIDTLQFIFSSQPFGATRAHGTRSFGMWAPTTEVAVGGLPPATGNSLLTNIRYLGQQGAPADARMFTALGSVGVTGFLLKDLEANPITYAQRPDLVARQRLLSDWFDSNDPDLRAFQRRGGKLIMAIGTNDTLASSGAQLDYYAALLKRTGQRRLDRFARLYVLPQRGHGLQGNSYTTTGTGRHVDAAPLPGRWDRLTLLQKWVEQDEAPSRTQIVTGAGDSSGLMCSYPEYPHYQGGAAGQAAAWQCRRP